MPYTVFPYHVLSVYSLHSDGNNNTPSTDRKLKIKKNKEKPETSETPKIKKHHDASTESGRHISSTNRKHSTNPITYMTKATQNLYHTEELI